MSSYLAKLNSEQLRAVEYGSSDFAEAGPLLIIAGAGTGKTNTLAHRVAHLIVNGVDPRRILLLTFTRRAAIEMGRRVERISSYALGENAGAMTDALTWSGTFHAIGARLLREYAPHVGLDGSFTIHDRGDSADLLNLVRHDLGFSKTEKRFPTKGTCLSIYSRAVNAERPLEKVLGRSFPWCAAWEAELRQLFSAYVEAKQRQHVLDYDDLLLYRAMHLTQVTQFVVAGSCRNIHARCWSFAIGWRTTRRAGTISPSCGGRRGSTARYAEGRIIGSRRGACVTAGGAVGRPR